MTQKVLEVNNLSTSFHKEKDKVNIVDGISFDIYERESIGIVGESGCGKSLTALSIMGLIKKPLTIQADTLCFAEQYDLSQLTRKKYKKIRAVELSMIFQEPMTALNPVMKIGKQIEEVLKIHTKLNKSERKEEIIQLIKQVGISRPEEIVKNYPHQLSGGMRQRIMIAMAIICKPKLLIADEPTTALDVTIQAQIIDLIKEIQANNNMALMLITHDLGVVHESCDRVAVMYAGRIVEIGKVKDVLHKPLHPYTQGLLASLPTTAAGQARLSYIKGNVPRPGNWSKGCRFADRCPQAMKKCHEVPPELITQENQTSVACWLYENEAVSTNGNQG
ncbi:ABC transporter ATP-binding protein [Metasolibacillus fluoroglycofenilyticus]|uniref:ABC transporter ATP-binding protein n=1 Tax=Metasolibacillus fluoroglycofenilyticus TaxID=1239396 RepID=UPI000D37F2D3|nr:ABC transporter ATP-binding protein [Metasolibacillus fluoroglycofenilyticus]